MRQAIANNITLLKEPAMSGMVTGVGILAAAIAISLIPQWVWNKKQRESQELLNPRFTFKAVARNSFYQVSLVGKVAGQKDFAELPDKEWGVAEDECGNEQCTALILQGEWWAVEGYHDQSELYIVISKLGFPKEPMDREVCVKAYLMFKEPLDSLPELENRLRCAKYLRCEVPALAYEVALEMLPAPPLPTAA